MIINFVQKKYFILLFIILSFTTYKLLYLENSNKIENYLQTKTEHIYLEYKVIYNNHKKLANFIFTNDINKKPIIDLFKNRDRENLLKYLNDDYKNLRLFNIRQLHFHLPNNNSFLRMHRPNKFGDSLTKDRLTVKYVNEEKEYIDGFEEGKVFNGFRFVYPLFDSKKHIGSVEISYSGLFFIKEIMKHYKLKTNLLISKKVVDKKVFDDEHSNYIDSFIDGYYFQKSIANYLNIDFSKNKLTKELSDSIKNSIEKGTPSSIYDEQNDRQ
ncbi:MAG: cache domain-containing protein, partial [Campylobacterota bacterium]|nr:cache domain-containing protein [Campylobacterota bacterium]